MHIKHKAVSWNDIYGQDHIKKIVNSIELNGRAFLFEGEKGTGKSQMAYILAKMIGCSDDSIIQRDCVRVSDVESMRQLVSDFTSSSVFQDTQALILDEIQELSHKAQETLLNPLLNLPEKTIVIACSAVPEKIEKMLVERFTVLKTKSLDEETSVAFLKSILEREKIKLHRWKKVMILSFAEGNPRRILKAIPIVTAADSEEEIKYLLVSSNMQDIAGESMELFKYILSANSIGWPVIFNKINKVLSYKHPSVIRMDLLNLIAYRLGAGNIENKMGTNLVLMASLLRHHNNIPDKATLEIDLYHSHLVMLK